jgi:hypothetical protein
MRELLDSDAMKRWSAIDGVIGAFAGEHDSMTVTDLGGLLAALGVDGYQQARTLADQAIIDELKRGGWGSQRIASRILVKDAGDGHTLPLDRSFGLFGQRYTVDSNVFVNTTYDRVPARMMPNPLDISFAALGNNAATELLSPEFSNIGYVSGLAKSRVLVDAHEASYWDSSLYTSWLGALRALSPSEQTLASLPSVAKTRAFQNRILNTQLASWAELRHDTILYAKQSYSIGASCEFPDAYVDPYPEFYARLHGVAERIGDVIGRLPQENLEYSRQQILNWVQNFETAMSYLQRMAEDQRSGTPHSQELLDFVNEAVKWEDERNCDGSTLHTNVRGWYTKLFFEDGNFEYTPTIADVHTQPTDEVGNDVGRVLHVGTGSPRLLVVSVDTCSGPRAYAGLASSYFESIQENWTRLDDQQWTSLLGSAHPADVPWMSDLVGK